MALSLPPDQEKRIGVDMVIGTFGRSGWARLAQHAAPLQRRGMEASTFCVAEMGRSSAAPLLGGGSSALVLTAEAVVHAYADVAAQGWIADYVLILLVEEIGYAGVDGNAAEEIEGCGE